MSDLEFNGDNRFDIRVAMSRIAEERLAETLGNKKLELKTDYYYQKSGNACVEYMCRDKLSGIGATEADFWFHELFRDNVSLGYIAVPVPRLKQIVRDRITAGKIMSGVGDDGAVRAVLLKPSEFF